MPEINISIAICVSSFVALLIILRRDTVSLGLPIAYLFTLLLIHLPGAYAYMVDDQLTGINFVKEGIGFTAIGSVSYVAGVLVTSVFSQRAAFFSQNTAAVSPIDSSRFAVFCLVGGWFFTYGLSFLHRIPSLGAAVDKAGAIWMLGVMLGLRSSFNSSNPIRVMLWGTALLVYPIIMLVLGGFMSYGAGAMIVVLSILLISVKGRFKIGVGLIVGVYIGLSVFVNYFGHRNEIRKESWGGASLTRKIDAASEIIRDFKLLNSGDHRQMFAFADRLNQNYFVGLAASRIEGGYSKFLYGRSVWEGMMALVPRVIWPSKPVFAGSPKIVSEMTGLSLDRETSFGVGNVMELQINFGMPGVVLGFFLLGMLLRILDRRAAVTERYGQFGNTIMYFLPAVALIQPNGSFVELCSGSAAACVGAIGWKWAWRKWTTLRTNRASPGSMRHKMRVNPHPSRR